MTLQEKIENLLVWLKKDKEYQEKERGRLSDEWEKYMKEGKNTKNIDFLSDWRHGMSWYAGDMIEMIEDILNEDIP